MRSKTVSRNSAGGLKCEPATMAIKKAKYKRMKEATWPMN